MKKSRLIVLLLLAALCLSACTAAVSGQNSSDESQTASVAEASSELPDESSAPADEKSAEETSAEESVSESSEAVSEAESEIPPESSAEQSAEDSKEVSAEPSEEPDESSEEPKEDGKMKSVNQNAFRVSSIYDCAGKSGEVTYKMKSPYADTFTFKCGTATKLQLFDAKGELIVKGNTKINAELKEDQIVYLLVRTGNQKFFDLTVYPEKHKVELPYEINSSVDLSKYSTESASAESPMKACDISYTKRTDSRALYVNCNNPEKLSDEYLNRCLCADDVTEKDVFFTYEHNNAGQGRYYGYRVTNTGKDDLFITVKNLGQQLDGSGTWLGEDEWIKFYNLDFRADTASYTDSQKKNFDAYVGFCSTYKSLNRQPVTYRVPAGEYIYVMGGTSADAYGNINVFASADKSVTGGCSNGAVLFSTYGSSAKGEFVAYTTAEKLKKNLEKEPVCGYVGNSDVGSQYSGSDNCHGVVDCDLVWVFNDATKSGALPVSYSNDYATSLRSGSRYTEIKGLSKKAFNNVTTWVTHINPNNVANAIGTDMTFYNTVDSVTKEPIRIDYMHFDGKGNTSNIGNWMVDYIDTITLVNQGDKDRTFTYNMKQNGSILSFIRDKNGDVVESYAPTYNVIIATSTYGAAINQPFTYTVTVKAHSICRFSVDYNLLANSCGAITHSAYLK